MEQKILSLINADSAVINRKYSKPILTVFPSCVDGSVQFSNSQQKTLSSRISKYAKSSDIHPVFSFFHQCGLSLQLRLEGKLEEGLHGNIIVDMTDEEQLIAIDGLWDGIGVSLLTKVIWEDDNPPRETPEFLAPFRLPSGLGIDRESQ